MVVTMMVTLMLLLLLLLLLQDVVGVIIGGTLGHALCTGLAVVGGRFVSQRISMRTGICLTQVVMCISCYMYLYRCTGWAKKTRPV